MAQSVLNSAFYLPFGLRGTSEASATAALAQDLLCYDTVYILSDTMRAVGLLLAIMGRRALEMALRTEAIKIVRDRHFVGWLDPRGSAIPPFILFEGFAGSPDQGRGLACAPPGVQASTVLRGFDLTVAESNHLATLAAVTTVNYGSSLPSGHTPPSALDSTLPFCEDLERFKRLLNSLNGFSLTSQDLDLTLRTYDSPKGLGRKIHTFGTEMPTGMDLMADRPPLDRKRLELLGLCLASHFDRVYRELVPAGTLHTEPLVEAVIRESLGSGRNAAGQEITEVLEAERIALPTTDQPNSFPFEELLLERQRPGWRAFRSLVDARDADHGSRLIQEYLAAMRPTLKRRVTSGVFELLLRRLAGALGVVPLGGTQVATTMTDTVLGPNRTYFIDQGLRRIADSNPKPADP